MGILYEQNYNSQAENVREDFIPENLPTVQHVQINFGLKHRSLTYQWFPTSYASIQGELLRRVLPVRRQREDTSGVGAKAIAETGLLALAGGGSMGAPERLQPGF